MFVVDLKYLKKVGLYYDESADFMRVRKNSFRYPTLSCKLREEDEDEDGNQIGNNLIFVLSYFISDDFAKQQIEFTIEDWQQFGMDCELFKNLRKNDFFHFFSITNTLVMNVYKSRLKGRKAWKKRNWALPFRNSSVREAFGVGERANERNNVSLVRSVDYVKSVEQIVELDNVMNLCVHKAAQDFSYAPFDVYFDCYKKKIKLTKKIEDDSLERLERVARDKVFKEFAKQVLSLQKGQ
jgi:hypothetical protein